MDEKIFCNIMNRIRKQAKQEGSAPEDTRVMIHMIGGTIFFMMLNGYEILDDFIEAWNVDVEQFEYVPIKNILRISA